MESRTFRVSVKVHKAGCVGDFKAEKTKRVKGTCWRGGGCSCRGTKPTGGDWGNLQKESEKTDQRPCRAPFQPEIHLEWLFKVNIIIINSQSLYYICLLSHEFIKEKHFLEHPPKLLSTWSAAPPLYKATGRPLTCSQGLICVSSHSLPPGFYCPLARSWMTSQFAFSFT